MKALSTSWRNRDTAQIAVMKALGTTPGQES